VNELIIFLKQVPQDVYLHFIVGLIVYQLATAYFRVLTWAPIVIVLCVALLKEVLDIDYVIASKMYLEPAKDIAVTLIGGLVGRFLLCIRR
jgi:hypothetical protein